MQTLWHSRRFQQWGIPLLIFILAFLPRTIYPVSRPMQWYNRSIAFMDAVQTRDWATTYQRGHPGVTTMWIAGLGIKAFARMKGVTSAQLLGLKPAKPGIVDNGVTAGVIALAFVISLCIGLTYPLLKRITRSGTTALAGSIFLALDPFHITHSKVLHVDALLATFMIISALFLLSYLRHKRQSDLILSGVLAGLAFLTKTPSLFLVPYTSLLVGVNSLTATQSNVPSTTKLSKTIHRSRKFLVALLIWGGVAVLTFVILWPAMWVEPLHVLDRMEGRSGYHVTRPNINPTFFNDKLTFDDPGLPFYLATMAWKTTLVTLPLACTSLIWALSQLRRRGKDNRVVWMFTVYIVCYTFQMELSAHKETRYLLPIFPALDVSAALGLAQIVETLGHIQQGQMRRWLSTVPIVLLLTLQAGLVIRHHPYYGTHHNYLLGGSQVAQHILPLQDEGEGLDLAARYLNSLPRTQQATASIHPLGAELFARTFMGTLRFNQPSESDYRIYYVNQVTRQLGNEEWMKAWQRDQKNEPLWTVDFDGVTYVWVYGEPPGKPAAGGSERQLDHRLGEHIILQQVRLNATTLAPGDTLTIVPLWRSDGKVKQNYMVFCHVLSADGELVAQKDGPPVYGARPTPSWRAGEVIEDVYHISLDDTLAPGEYELSIGMYDLKSMVRLPAFDEAGNRLPKDRIILASLHIAPEPGGD